MQRRKIFGPPGTGKTTYLLDVMEQELKAGVRPDRIAYLSFTRQARYEAVSRAGELLGYTHDDLPYFRTLHSIAYRALGSPELAKGPKDLAPLGDALGLRFTGKGAAEDPLSEPPVGGELGDQLLALDHYRRHNLLDPLTAWKRWEGEASWYVVKRFFDGYAAWRQREGVMDFTELLEQPLDPLDVDVVIVDEAQDLSRLQWLALERLATRAKRVYVAGDDDQAIFVWAGASAEAFLQYPCDDVVVLGQSYRLPRAVHRRALGLVSRLRVRQPKDFRPRDEDGEVRRLLDPDQAHFDWEGTHLVLYRTHRLGRPFEEALRASGEPYTKGNEPAPGLEHARAVETWARLSQGRRAERKEVLALYDLLPVGQGIDRGARQRVKDAPDGTVFDVALLREQYGFRALGTWDRVLRIDPDDVQYLKRVVAKGRHLDPPRVRLSTIHASKGAEADHVTLLTDVSRKIREAMERDPDDERRVFYVGVTRAKHTLTLVGTDNPLI